MGSCVGKRDLTETEENETDYNANLLEISMMWNDKLVRKDIDSTNDKNFALNILASLICPCHLIPPSSSKSNILVSNPFSISFPVLGTMPSQMPPRKRTMVLVGHSFVSHYDLY